MLWTAPKPLQSLKALQPPGGMNCTSDYLAGENKKKSTYCLQKWMMRFITAAVAGKIDVRDWSDSREEVA